MKTKTVTDAETLHEFALKIKGNEPFLKFHKTGMIVNFNSYGGQNHNLIEVPFGYGTGVPLDRLRKGDVLRFQIVRERQAIEVIPPWYVRLWKFVRKTDRTRQ